MSLTSPRHICHTLLIRLRCQSLSTQEGDLFLWSLSTGSFDIEETWNASRQSTKTACQDHDKTYAHVLLWSQQTNGTLAKEWNGKVVFFFEDGLVDKTSGLWRKHEAMRENCIHPSGVAATLDELLFNEWQKAGNVGTWDCLNWLWLVYLLNWVNLSSHGSTLHVGTSKPEKYPKRKFQNDCRLVCPFLNVPTSWEPVYFGMTDKCQNLKTKRNKPNTMQHVGGHSFDPLHQSVWALRRFQQPMNDCKIFRGMRLACLDWQEPKGVDSGLGQVRKCPDFSKTSKNARPF